MTKHTPGPIHRIGTFLYELTDESENGINVWDTQVHAHGGARRGEDMARLFAAAPDLLVALRNLLDHTCGTDSFCEWCARHAPKDQGGSIVGPIPHVSDCLWLAAERAIAKAEGRG